MKLVLTRLLPLVLLLLMSVAVRGNVKVDIDTFTGGTVVEKSQSEPAANGTVTVTITVTPASGYRIAKDDVIVAATLPAEGIQTRAVQVAMMLTLAGDDPADLTQPRDYSFEVEEGFGAWVQAANFHQQGTSGIEAGTYRIYIDNEEKWYLWPSVTTDDNGHPYLTTFNGTQAPALDYPSKNISYGAFDETYSLWQVTPVDVDGAIYYQLFNIGLQQYVVWNAAEGLKAVHLEASPADVSHTYFRFDGEQPNFLITPSEAAAGTTLNSNYGDKPFLCASGAANSDAGYPNGEPDPNGEGGLMRIYDANPVWTLERADNYVSLPFAKTSKESEETAALFSPTSNLAIPEGMTAYLVTGVDVMAGSVLLQPISYLPEGVPSLLLADGATSGFVIQPKNDETPLLTDEEVESNLLRVGSPTVQPKAYEDYILFRGEFVMVSGGTLKTGKIFLDLGSSPAAKTRTYFSINNKNNTTGIVKRWQQPAVENYWYTLDGRRLSGKPSHSGLYIRNGRKLIVR